MPICTGINRCRGSGRRDGCSGSHDVTLTWTLDVGAAVEAGCEAVFSESLGRYCKVQYRHLQSHTLPTNKVQHRHCLQTKWWTRKWSTYSLKWAVERFLYVFCFLLCFSHRMLKSNRVHIYCIFTWEFLTVVCYYKFCISTNKQLQTSISGNSHFCLTVKRTDIQIYEWNLQRKSSAQAAYVKPKNCWC